ncbi:MAG: hypothetical protein ACFB0G_11750 [Leptolyngbyaceae cyanobacterium]
MKRFFQTGLVGLAAAAVIGMPMMMSGAIAQTRSEVFAELDLTADQQEQIQAILAGRREDVESIFTDEQREQFREAYEESQDFRAAAAAVDDLTDDQKAEYRAVAQASRDEISAVLTEEQLEELRSRMQERRNNRRNDR